MKNIAYETLQKKLKALGHKPIPKDHVRRNKGITVYFYAHSQIPDVAHFLYDLFGDGKGVEIEYNRGYVPVMLNFMFTEPGGECNKWLDFYIGPKFVSVCIIRWR